MGQRGKNRMYRWGKMGQPRIIKKYYLSHRRVSSHGTILPRSALHHWQRGGGIGADACNIVKKKKKCRARFASCYH